MLTPHPNDPLAIAPAIARLPAPLGQVKVRLAETGDHRATNLDRGDAAALAPRRPASRQTHHPPLAERIAADPATPTPVEVVAHRLRTRAGQARYAKRNATVEPVFGILKHVLGFRQFLRRGRQAVQGEWLRARGRESEASVRLQSMKTARSDVAVVKNGHLMADR